MNFFQKHADTAVVIGALLTAVMWMRSEFKDVSSEMRTEIASIRSDIAEIQKDINMIKTVLIMKNIMPQELATIQKAELVPISKKDIIEQNSN
jgi:hypothetical protein